MFWRRPVPEPAPDQPPILAHHGEWYLDGMVVMQVAPDTFFVGRDPDHPDLADKDYEQQAEAFEKNFPEAKVIVFHGPIRYVPAMAELTQRT